MPGVMVLIVDHPALFVPVRGKHIQRSLQVMPHQSRLKFQRGQRRHAAGGKTGDRTVPDILLPGCLLHRMTEILCDVDHAHVGLGVVGLCFRINGHCRILPVFSLYSAVCSAALKETSGIFSLFLRIR